MTLDQLMDQILDVLIEEHGYFTAPYGEVLVRLAQRAYGDDTIVAGLDKRYQATSRAVLRLEYLEFVEVERAHRDEAAKANVLLGIRLR